jgi:hypothetical protein
MLHLWKVQRQKEKVYPKPKTYIFEDKNNNEVKINK